MMLANMSASYSQLSSLFFTTYLNQDTAKADITV